MPSPAGFTPTLHLRQQQADLTAPYIANARCPFPRAIGEVGALRVPCDLLIKGHHTAVIAGMQPKVGARQGPKLTELGAARLALRLPQVSLVLSPFPFRTGL